MRLSEEKRGPGTYTLKNLLPPDVVQAGVKVLDAPGQILQLALVGALDGARLADGDVERQPNAAVGVTRRQPSAPAAVGRGREADLVVSGLSRREGELAARAAALRDDAVVVVKDFLERGVLLVEV